MSFFVNQETYTHTQLIFMVAYSQLSSATSKKRKKQKEKMKNPKIHYYYRIRIFNIPTICI